MLKLYLQYLTGFFLIIAVHSNCTLFLNDGNNYPHLIKEFGSKRLRLRRPVSYIQLSEEETVTVLCSSKIIFRNLEHVTHNDYHNSVKLVCTTGNSVAYSFKNNISFADSHTDSLNIYCSEKVTQMLHESKKILPNCDKYVSYGIGLKSENSKDFVSAGFCYDLNSFSLKYATYLASHSQGLRYQKIFADLNIVSLDRVITQFQLYIPSLRNDDFVLSLQDSKWENTFLPLFDFDYMNIVQEPVMQKDLEEFETFLNIVWWRNLRLGNWKNYLDIFAERVTVVNYLVHIGTTGVVSVPLKSNACKKMEMLSIRNADKTVDVPEYIWASIKSLKANISEQFVVIGYNSPFFQNANNTIFCKDMCDEIEWIKESLLSSVRLIPSLGIVFCCRPEEVAETIMDFPHLSKQLSPSANSDSNGN